MSYRRTYRRTAPTTSTSLSGFFGDMVDSWVYAGKSLKNLVTEDSARLGEAAGKARADRIVAEAYAQVDAEQKARAQLAAAGGAALPPPLTAEQRNLAALMKEKQLRERNTVAAVVGVGLLAAGGYWAWKKVRP